MEILFENNYTRNKEWAKEFYKYFYFRRPFFIVLYILFAIHLVLRICDLFIKNSMGWEPTVAVVVLIALIVFSYNKKIKMVIKRDLEIHGKPIEIVVTVTDEIIKQTSSTGSEIQLNYIGIKKAIHTKKYVYLWSKTNMVYSFKNDSFSVGDESNFLTFLKDKGIKVK